MAAQLADFYVQEAPVSACLNNSSDCDPELVIEKRFVTLNPLTVSAGITLEPGTTVRSWYLGASSAEAKALRSQGGDYKNACTAAKGGCLVLFADSPLSLPDKNKLYAQLGQFHRLESLDFSRDTPGIVRSLATNDRLLSISVHGTLDVHGLALRVQHGQIVDEQAGTVLRATTHVGALDGGQVRTNLTIGSKGEWNLKGHIVQVQNASIGSYDLGNISLEHDSKRRWTASVKARMPGLKPPMTGTLILADGVFKKIVLKESLDAEIAQTGLNLECINGEILPSSRGPHFKGQLSLRGGKTGQDQDRWRINASILWDTLGLRGEARTYVNVSNLSGEGNFLSTTHQSFCTDDGNIFKGTLAQSKTNLSIDIARGSALIQGRLSLPPKGGLLVTRPLEIRDGSLFYRGQGTLSFPNSFAVVGGDQVTRGNVQLEIGPNKEDSHVALGWTNLGATTVGLRVDLEKGQISTFGADAERARRSELQQTPNFAPSEPDREKALRTALLVDDPQVNTLRKAARAPDSEVNASLLDIRDLVLPNGQTIVRIDVRGIPEPSKRLKTAWEMLNAYYTSPSRYDMALNRQTSNFGQTLYEPPRVVSPYLWGTKTLRLQTRSDKLGLMPTAVPSTIWGAWGLRSNLGCAGHFGARGSFGSATPDKPVDGAEKRAFCWLGTKAHFGSRVDDVFDYPVGETAIGSVSKDLSSKWVKRPYKYNMMPGRSLKSCGNDRAPGALDCDPYLVEQGLSCEQQQRYVGATRVGSCAPVLHEYRPLILDTQVVHFDESDKYGTLRSELRDRARSEDGSLKLPAGTNPLIQCPSEVTQLALSKTKALASCTQPGQFCRAYVDVNNGGVPSLGPAFQCSSGGSWQPVGLSPLEAAGFPKACQQGGSWEASIKREGDKFIGTDQTRTTVSGQCTLVGSKERYRGVGWGWWGDIPNPYCETTSKGPKAGRSGGKTLSAALAERAFQACSHPWNVSTATRDWQHQLAGCDNPQTSLSGPDFGECKFTKSMGVPLRLVAWDKNGSLYQWEPLELEHARSDAKHPRGDRYSHAYIHHGGYVPAAGWGPDAQTIVDSPQACRDACDDLKDGCVAYTTSNGNFCWLATRAAFGSALTREQLKSKKGYATYLKAQPELFPTLKAGDASPCGPDMSLKSECSGRSNHTFILSPTNKKIGNRPGPLNQLSSAARQDALRHILKEAPLLLDPADRNRTGLRVMALTNRRLAAINGETHGLGSQVKMGPDFAIALSTQPSHLTAQLKAQIKVNAKERSLHATVQAAPNALKNTHVRFFVDTNSSGYDGRPLGDVMVNQKGEASLTWSGEPFGLDRNGSYHFYALAYHRDANGHRHSPPVLSSYAAQSLQASPMLSGRVSLGPDGKAGFCLHTVSEGQTCQSIAYSYGLNPTALKIQGTNPKPCSNADLRKGQTLVFAGSCGVQVFLDQNGDGILQPGQEPSTTTDHQGRFAFAKPPQSGIQQVTFQVPTGFHSREDFKASFNRFSKQSFKGTTLSSSEVPDLKTCQSLCHPIDDEAQANRHEVRTDFKECGGVLYQTHESKNTCTLILTEETKRTFIAPKRGARTVLYARTKQALRTIHRLIQVGKRPAVLPRVIFHREPR